MKLFYRWIFKFLFLVGLLLIAGIILSNLLDGAYKSTDETTVATPKQPPKYTDAKPVPKEAMFYKQLPNNIAKCRLCPWECTLKPSERGICKVRENQAGKLITLSYAQPCAINAIDPIEKKPFYHFLPALED